MKALSWLKNGLLAITLLMGSMGWAQSSPEELRQFLVEMGFQDRAAQIREAQAKGDYFNELNWRQQNRNMRSYEVMNMARELAITIYTQIESELANPEQQRQFAEFTAKMLALQPEPPPQKLPTEVMAVPEGTERELAAKAWLDQRRREVMESHTRKVVSDMIQLMFKGQTAGNERAIERLYAMTSSIVDRLYLDGIVGDTRYLGRALTYVLVRDARNQNRAGMEKQLQTYTRNRRLHLENFVAAADADPKKSGVEIVLDTSSGARRIRIDSGSMMMTRNLSASSLNIALAAVPADKEDYKRAKKLGIVGNILSAPFFITPEEARDKLTWAERISDKISQLNISLNDGMSHISVFAVKQSGNIRAPWKFDSYPQMTNDVSDYTANMGGVRFTGLEQTLSLEHHSRVLIANVDPVKFHAYATERARREGYPKDGVIMEAIRPELNETGNPILPDQPKSDPWKAEITPEEFRELHADNDPQRWNRKVSQRFVDWMERGIVRGYFFQWVTPIQAYFKGGLYCDGLVHVGRYGSMGVDFHQTPSKWNWPVHLYASIGRMAQTLKKQGIFPKFMRRVLENDKVERSMSLINMPILAPANSTTKPYVDAEVFDMKDRTLSERVATAYRSYADQNKELTESLEKVLPRSDARFNRFKLTKLDQTETASATVRDVEYIFSVRAARGKATEGIEGLEIGARGGELGMRRVTDEWLRRGKPDASADVLAAPACKDMLRD